ncbi:MAG: transketolase C-terminal domain-containing protein, partial [Caldicoprobacterales bacterium]
KLWITMEDNIVEGGFGSSINEYAVIRNIGIRIKNIGVPNIFVEHGTIKELKESLHLNADSIAMQIIYETIGKETCFAEF